MTQTGRTRTLEATILGGERPGARGYSVTLCAPSVLVEAEPRPPQSSTISSRTEAIRHCFMTEKIGSHSAESATTERPDLDSRLDRLEGKLDALADMVLALIDSDQEPPERPKALA